MIARIGRALRKLHQDTGGAMSVEKIAIIALISLPIILALLAFRKTLINWFTGKVEELEP